MALTINRHGPRVNPGRRAGVAPPASPAMWLRAGYGMFDATSGGSAVTTDRDGVDRWEDQSGNGRHCTQATAAELCIWDSVRQCVSSEVSFNQYYDAPASFTFDRRDFSLFLVCSLTSLRRNVGPSAVIGGNHVFLGSSSNTCNLYYPGVGSGADSWKLTAFNSSAKPTATIPYTTDLQLIGFVGRSSGFEGWSRTTMNSIAALTSGTSTISSFLGWTTDQGCLQAGVKDVLFYSRALTTDEIEDELFPYAVSRGVPASQTKQVVFVGDSITQGYKSTKNQSWPSQLTGLSGVYKRNTAEASITLATLNSQSSKDIALFRSGETNVVVLWAGTNDIVLSGSTGATVDSTMETLCDAYQAAGFKVIVATIIDRNFSAPQQTQADSFNTLIRADHSWADGFVDLAADSRLDDCTDTTYFDSDQIHLNNAGLAAVAELMQPEIVTQLA